jgi:hypothetical protein
VTLGRVTPCGRCQALVMVATTDHGLPLPVDPDPHPDGMLEVRWRAEVLRVRTVARADRARVRLECGGLYRAHLASCAGRSSQ